MRLESGRLPSIEDLYDVAIGDLEILANLDGWSAVTSPDLGIPEITPKVFVNVLRDIIHPAVPLDEQWPFRHGPAGRAGVDANQLHVGY